MNKKKLKNKKKKRVPKRMFFYNAYEGSDEWVPNWDDYLVARGYYYDLEKVI